MAPLTAPPVGRTTRSETLRPGVLLILAVVLVVTVGLVVLPPPSPHVDELTFTNPNAFEVNVDVTGGPGDGWIGIGPIEGDEADTILEVLDVGRTWIFRFQAPGAEERTLSFERRQLESDDWTVAIPVLSDSR